MIIIKTDNKWKFIVEGYEIPKNSKWRKEYNWLEDFDSSGFVRYYRQLIPLANFLRTDGYPPPVNGWDGIETTSFSTGYLVKLSKNGEEYQIASYRTTSE